MNTPSSRHPFDRERCCVEPTGLGFGNRSRPLQGHDLADSQTEALRDNDHCPIRFLEVRQQTRELDRRQHTRSREALGTPLDPHQGDGVLADLDQFPSLRALALDFGAKGRLRSQSSTAIGLILSRGKSAHFGRMCVFTTER